MNDKIHFLGKLCSYGHKYDGQDKSLRYVNGGYCCRCSYLNSKRRSRWIRYGVKDKKRIKSKHGIRESKEFMFPKILKEDNLIFNSEYDFESFIIVNDWMQRSLGIYDVIKNGFCPDITAKIYDCDRNIKIEVEYWAENFARHQHDPFSADLILSYFRKKNTNNSRGVPVWSFYYYDNDTDVFVWTLENDIMNCNI